MREVVRAVDAEGMEAHLKCGDEALLASECQGTGEVSGYVESARQHVGLYKSRQFSGAVDILQYEIYCKDILHMRQTWNELSRPERPLRVCARSQSPCISSSWFIAFARAFQGEEQPIRIVALRDGFAEEDSKRRCCEVVLCVEGRVLSESGASCGVRFFSHFAARLLRHRAAFGAIFGFRRKEACRPLPHGSSACGLVFAYVWRALINPELKTSP